MSESTLKNLSLYDISHKGKGAESEDDLLGTGRPGDTDSKNDDEGGKKEEDEEKDEDGGSSSLKSETESEKKARKEREKEERRLEEEEARLDREKMSQGDKFSLTDASSQICCVKNCGRVLTFHPCPCLAPVHIDPIPYDASLEKRKRQHPEWYDDPYGLDEDDMAARILRMLMGEISDEEAADLLQQMMKDEETESEEEDDELETPSGSPAEPLSRASSPGDYDWEESLEKASEAEEEEGVEYDWPTCREFTAELGEAAILDFIATKWLIPQHYKYCADFLGSVKGPPEQVVEDFHYRIRFSVPTRLEPIPLQRGDVFFVISVMLNPDRPRDEKVYVGFYLESTRVRFAAEIPFRYEWLQMLMENKHRLADDWGRTETNVYQYVLDGPEADGRKLTAAEPKAQVEEKYWIPSQD